MSNKNSNYDSAESGLTIQEASSLLDTLCTKYGVSLPPLWRTRLMDNPPRTVEKFTDTVFHAEGLSPQISDKSLYKEILGEIRRAYDRCKESTEHRVA
jgi:hypothetical protein